MNFSIGFLLDAGILLLLAATVFLAFRLTLSLRNFRESRFEMEGLVNRLTANIEQAEKAIGGMQNAARKAGLELDEIISDSKKLADELKFMNETGNNLATRLEKLAERNRELVDRIESGAGAAPIQYKAAQTHAPVQGGAPERGFSIQDKDFDDDLEAELEGFDARNDGLQSQAERELFEALKSSKSRQRGRA